MNRRQEPPSKAGSLVGLLLLVLWCLGITPQAGAQEEAELRFQEGMTRYRAQAFAAAHDLFQKLLQRFPRSARRSASWLLLAKSTYHLGQYNQALNAVGSLRREFPYSAYLDDALYIGALAHYRAGRPGDALLTFDELLNGPADNRLREAALQSAEAILAGSMDTSARLALQGRVTDPDLVALFTFYQGEAAYKEDAYTLAQETLERFLGQYPQHRLKERAEALLNLVRQGKPLRIGVICPLTGEYARPTMMEGIQLAVAEHNRTVKPAIHLFIEDSGGRVIQAIKAAQRLIKEDRVVAIVGPIYSDEVIGAATVADCEGIPLLTPTATDVGIASIGPYVFQVNITPEMQGKRLAEYAIQQLGLRTVAVLAPNTPYGKQLADSFMARITELGGNVVAIEWYYPGTTDFTAQFKRLREAGFALATPDSLEQAPSQSMMQEEQEEELAPLLTAIEGLFVPADDSEELARSIAPQVAFHRIQTQLLGGSYWNSWDLVREGGLYVDGAVFTADFYDQHRSVKLYRFRETYRQTYGVPPDKVAVFAYDAIKLLIKVIAEGADTPLKIRDQLAAVQGFEGVGGKISFRHSDRVNDEVFILMINNGNIEYAPGFSP